jgi:hypothetical protein
VVVKPGELIVELVRGLHSGNRAPCSVGRLDNVAGAKCSAGNWKSGLASVSREADESCRQSFSGSQVDPVSHLVMQVDPRPSATGEAKSADLLTSSHFISRLDSH